MRIFSRQIEDAAAPHVKRKAAVLAVLAASPEISADEVRASMGVTVKELPDGAIHQIALDAGMRVEL